MEQMIDRLLAEMKADREEMTTMLEDKIEVIQKKVDDGQEEMKAQLSSLASRIDANQEEMKAMLDTSLGKWRQIQENTSP
jgi:transcription termination factor NusB